MSIDPEYLIPFHCFGCDAKSNFEIERVKVINSRPYAYGDCINCGKTAARVIKSSLLEKIKSAN